MTKILIFQKSDEVEEYKAGEVIFREGDHGDSMYVVTEGEVEISVNGKLVEVADAGSIMGEMALIDQSPRSATATAKTDCKLVSIGQKRFTFLVRETPFFALQVMQVMAERLRRVKAY